MTIEKIYCANRACKHNNRYGQCTKENIDLYVDENGVVKCHSRL